MQPSFTRRVNTPAACDAELVLRLTIEDRHEPRTCTRAWVCALAATCTITTAVLPILPVVQAGVQLRRRMIHLAPIEHEAFVEGQRIRRAHHQCHELVRTTLASEKSLVLSCTAAATAFSTRNKFPLDSKIFRPFA
jgi:Ser/Thr protein kinase RdoA (MazF antagonist)